MADKEIQKMRNEKSTHYHFEHKIDIPTQEEHDDQHSVTSASTPVFLDSTSSTRSQQSNERHAQEISDEELARRIYNDQQEEAYNAQEGQHRKQSQQNQPTQDTESQADQNLAMAQMRTSVSQQLQDSARNSENISFDADVDLARQLQHEEVQNYEHEQEQEREQPVVNPQRDLQSIFERMIETPISIQGGPVNFRVDFSRQRGSSTTSTPSFDDLVQRLNNDGTNLSQTFNDFHNDEQMTSRRNVDQNMLRQHDLMRFASDHLFDSPFDSRPRISIRHGFGSGSDGIDLENLDYERLLELSGRIGVVNRGADTETISNLPTRKILKQDTKSSISYDNKMDTSESNSQNKSCCICMEEFEEGDEVRSLPCFHIFHKTEIDKWLLINKVCPICKTKIDFRWRDETN